MRLKYFDPRIPTITIRIPQKKFAIWRSSRLLESFSFSWDHGDEIVMSTPTITIVYITTCIMNCNFVVIVSFRALIPLRIYITKRSRIFSPKAL